MPSDAYWVVWLLTFWAGLGCGWLIGHRSLTAQQRQELKDYRSVFGDPGASA